jgi:hypothetical protein
MPLDWQPNEAGTGTLLMTAPGLTRHKNDRPHQALFFFDADSKPTRLVTNENGDPLGYDLDDRNHVIEGEDELIVLPPDIARVAREWLADHLAARKVDKP